MQMSYYLLFLSQAQNTTDGKNISLQLKALQRQLESRLELLEVRDNSPK